MHACVYVCACTCMCVWMHIGGYCAALLIIVCHCPRVMQLKCIRSFLCIVCMKPVPLYYYHLSTVHATVLNQVHTLSMYVVKAASIIVNVVLQRFISNFRKCCQRVG